MWVQVQGRLRVALWDEYGGFIFTRAPTSIDEWKFFEGIWDVECLA